MNRVTRTDISIGYGYYNDPFWNDMVRGLGKKVFLETRTKVIVNTEFEVSQQVGTISEMVQDEVEIRK